MNPLYYWNSNIVPPWCGNCNHEMSSFDNHKWYPIYPVNTAAQVFTCLGHCGGLSSSWKDLCDPLYQRMNQTDCQEIRIDSCSTHLILRSQAMPQSRQSSSGLEDSGGGGGRMPSFYCPSIFYHTAMGSLN